MVVFNVTEAMCCSIWAVILSFSTVKERAFTNNVADDNSMILISNDEMDKGSCESHWSVSPLLISNVLRFSDSIRISFHSVFVGRGSGVGLYYHMNTSQQSSTTVANEKPSNSHRFYHPSIIQSIHLSSDVYDNKWLPPFRIHPPTIRSVYPWFINS